MFIDIIGYKRISHFEEYFHDKVKSVLHMLIKGIELKKSITSWLEFKKKNPIQKHGLLTFFLLFLLLVITFISRSYLSRFDSYSLSNSWSLDLVKVVDFDNQKWFGNEMNATGNMAFVSFYSKIINISPEIALQSMGMLQSLLITVLLFWSTRFITFSKYLSPLLSSLSFALLYTVIPLNLNYLLQPKPIFLALSFALPAMIYLLKPNLLMLKRVEFFLGFFTVFFTISLIDLFVFFILLPPFLLISLLLTKSRSNKKFWLGLLAYCISAFLTISISYLISSDLHLDFFQFLHWNLVSVDSYTYIPQLIFPLNKLLAIYLFITFFAILILLKLIFYDKEDWKASLAFLVYFAVLILLLSLKSSWLDSDLIIISIAVFIPLVIGIVTAIFIRIVSKLFVEIESYKYQTTTFIIVVFVYLSFHFQKDAFENTAETDKINEEVLSVYNEIISDYFPYTYAVVNDYSTQVVSENEHYFLNYSSFLDGYPQRDSIYFKNVKNPVFLKKHPEYIIPQSVFLFIYNGKKASYFSDNNTQFNPDLIKLLKELKGRGRKIEVFCENENFKVYEIINEPRSSKILDLIF